MPAVLAVDDDFVTHEILKLVMDKAGLDIHGVFSAEDGWDHLSRHAYEFAILDIYLPGQSGVDLLARLRGSARTRHLPVIMLTASKDRESLTRCARLGIADYVVKPFDTERMVAKVLMLRRNLELARQTLSQDFFSRWRLEERPEVLHFYLEGQLSKHTVTQFQNLWTPALKRRAQDSAALLDISALPELVDRQIDFFMDMVESLLPEVAVKVVAGRNFGLLVPCFPDFEERLFIIADDAYAWLRARG